MSQENLWGGFQSDEAKELQGSFDGLVFGLNEKVQISKFEYTTKTGAGNTEGSPALDITLVVNGTEKNTRIYEPGANGTVYYKGKPVTDKNSEDFTLGLRQGAILAKGLITHYLKSLGYTEEQLTKNLSTVKSFQELCTKSASAVSKHLGKTEINLFAHYQNSIKGSATQTYLEIPENLAYGAFLSPAFEAKGGSWEAQNDWEENGKKVKGLRYVDGEGNVHTFKRDKSYMEGNRANKQTKSDTPTNSAFSLPNPNDIAPATPATSNDGSASDDDDW